MRVKRITEAIKTKVYTDSGDFFGEVEEANLCDNKVEGWRIRVDGGMSSLIGGARGVIIPHQYVKAISDIVIINKVSLPNPDSDFSDMSEELM